MLILCGFWRCTDDVFPLSEFHLFLGEQESTPVRSNLSCPMSKPKGQNLSQSNSLKTTFIYKDHFQSISIQLLLLFLNSFFFLSLFSHAFVFLKKSRTKAIGPTNWTNKTILFLFALWDKIIHWLQIVRKSTWILSHVFLVAPNQS